MANLAQSASTNVRIKCYLWNDFVLELEAISSDIIFCTETWREDREEYCLTPSGHHIYLSGGDGHREVGICILQDQTGKVSEAAGAR